MRKTQTLLATIIVGLVLVILALGVTQALAGPNIQGGSPTLISYQGYLTGSDGQPISGTVTLRFSLYDVPSDGTPLWEETQNNILVGNGYFAVMLGSVTPLSATHFDDPTRYLQVSIDNGSGFVNLPRQQFAAVPYALQAQAAASAPWSGLSGVPTGLADNVDNDTLAGLACANGQIPGWNGSAWVCTADETGNFWSLTGNTGATPGANFLGTTDAVSLTLAVSGTTALRIEPATDFNATLYPNLIGGHTSNFASENVHGAVIGGGRNNEAGGVLSTIGGGKHNTVGGGGYIATVGGGSNNVANGILATVGGGGDNTAADQQATVSGGRFNQATAPYATIGGGGGDTVADGNRVTDDYGTVAGGSNNQAGDNAGATDDAPYATVGGGRDNTAGDDYATVGGGRANTAGGLLSTVGGGQANVAGDKGTTVSGLANTAGGAYATISGGLFNVTSGSHATVGGGANNTASGNYATVGGGWHNTAAGSYSFAAGSRAKANHDGVFIWADSGGFDFSSTGNNQFLIDAHGGVGIGTNTPLTQLHVAAARNGAANLSDHVMVVENNALSTDSGPDVLALKVSNQTDPSGSTNYITFADQSGGIAAIEGNGSGGVVYKTSGADFAEYLPVHTAEETLQPGEIVGLSSGQISRQTKGAEQVFVVSSAAGFVGNMQRDEKIDSMALVALLGQTLVRVRGSVRAGDYIIPSGRDDGFGLPLSLENLTPASVVQVVGLALTGAETDGISEVTVLVGLPRDLLWSSLLAQKEAQNAALQKQLTSLEIRLADLEAASASPTRLVTERLWLFGLGILLLGGLAWLIIRVSRSGKSRRVPSALRLK